jgi:beta-galactosidase
MRERMAASLCGFVFALLASCGSSPEKGAHDRPADSDGSGGTGGVLRSITSPTVRPFAWGKFVWVMFDFASATRNEGDTPGINDKGLVTHDRQTKKDAFYFYKASWTADPFVYITSRRFEPRTMATTDIKVYANTDSVELKLNGASLGSKTSADHIFVWPAVTLTKGSNTADAIGTNAGVSTYADSVVWTLN